MNFARESSVTIPRFELYALLRAELARRGVQMPERHEEVAFTEETPAPGAEGDDVTYVLTWRELSLPMPLP